MRSPLSAGLVRRASKARSRRLGGVIRSSSGEMALSVVGEASGTMLWLAYTQARRTFSEVVGD